MFITFAFLSPGSTWKFLFSTCIWNNYQEQIFLIKTKKINKFSFRIEIIFIEYFFVKLLNEVSRLIGEICRNAWWLFCFFSPIPNSFAERFLGCCQIHWNGWYFLFCPLILLPLLFLKPELVILLLKWFFSNLKFVCLIFYQEYRTMFIILWAFLWYSAEVPTLAATACLPIIFLPVMGVLVSGRLRSFIETILTTFHF